MPSAALEVQLSVCLYIILSFGLSVQFYNTNLPTYLPTYLPTLEKVVTVVTLVTVVTEVSVETFSQNSEFKNLVITKKCADTVL